ncbi:hypothetical protein [Candidatus Ruminimicrobiellum ovillum]|uniref:hypothetical protein n=1 Tax=Candidatus Ruminimicrobiellum ovillum TaxID=1947927 RepID=UPI003559E5E2
MRKIKNFKISIRTREISRIIRKLLNTEDLPIEVEEAVQKSCFVCEKVIKPAVVYDTFSKEAMIFPVEFQAPEKWIAVSPYILTIGNVLEEEYNKNKELFGEYGIQIVSAISADALDQARNFVQKLLAAEAIDENCELSRSIELPKQYNQEIINFLPADKINLSLDDDGNFVPKNSMSGLYYWIPLKKRGRK